MSLTTIPQEIVDNIIDYFHDDVSMLKVCALVCPAWLPSCRSHLFEHISLQPPVLRARRFSIFGKSSEVQRLHRILTLTPEIASYIRDVLICEGMAGREWITQEQTLPSLLRKLTNTRSFQLERSASLPITWRYLPLDLRDAIGSVLASSSLVTLVLSGLVFEHPNELLCILQGCQILRNLRVDHLLLHENTSNVKPIEKKQRAPLDLLIIGPRTSTTLIDCLLHPDSTIDVAAVRRLGVAISGNFADFARLLRNCAALEVLKITLMNDIDLQAYWSLPPSERFDLSHNPHLHQLEVRIDVIQRQDDPLPWLNALFSTVTSPSALESIHIIYTLYLPSPYMDRSMNTTIFTGWKEIDTTLTGPEFDSLRSVRLEFSLENPIGFGVAPRFLKEVDLQSPALEARNIFVVEAFDTSG